MNKLNTIFKISKNELLGFVAASLLASGICAAAVSYAYPAQAHTASHICSYAKFASN
jgi:hypothetical protein